MCVGASLGADACSVLGRRGAARGAGNSSTLAQADSFLHLIIAKNRDAVLVISTSS